MKQTHGPKGPSLSAKLLELAEAKRQVQLHERQLSLQLAGLPEYYGFPNLPAFTAAIAQARKMVGVTSQPQRSAAPASRPSVPTPAGKKRRQRRSVTPEMQNKLKRLVGEGKTDKQVAAVLQMSVPNVYVYKKRLGLVGLRKGAKKPAPKTEKKK